MSSPASVRPALQFKVQPEDFFVEEIPAFEASGVGDHLYVHLRKTNRGTEEVLRAVARALGADARDASAAGLKDVRSVSTQWISVPLPAGARGVEVEERAKALALEGVEILETKRHNHKLRTGLLQGNRFTVLLRGARAEDVATIDADGYMQITDRSKDVIKSGGEWISSIDVENIAMAHPAVAMAACIGMKHPKWDERPIVAVVKKPGAEVTREELIAFYEGKTAKWQIPDDVVFVDAIPLGGTGKMQKSKLRELLKDYKLPEA